MGPGDRTIAATTRPSACRRMSRALPSAPEAVRALEHSSSEKEQGKEDKGSWVLRWQREARVGLSETHTVA